MDEKIHRVLELSEDRPVVREVVEERERADPVCNMCDVCNVIYIYIYTYVYIYIYIYIERERKREILRERESYERERADPVQGPEQEAPGRWAHGGLHIIIVY